MKKKNVKKNVSSNFSIVVTFNGRQDGGSDEAHPGSFSGIVIL